MAPPTESTMPTTRRTRKSIGSHDVRRAADKDNATIDVASSVGASRKKSRSKSLGPGGLDALQQGSGNRRASLAAPSRAPRSILKSTIAPLAEIPPLKKKEEEPDLIDLGEPKKKTPTQKPTSGDVNGSKIALRTEEEQQAASRAREERERRDARRKSLANRRVSFAAEATLHTFHDVEYMQDSTTSTDATRRNSAITGPQPGRESTPQEQIQGAPESPDNQRDLHQQKRRRSSGLPVGKFGTSDDDTIASAMYSSDSEPADAVEEIAEIEDDGSDSDSDDGTMMSMVTEEVTGTTIASDRLVDSTQENSTLDEVLRLAARRAGTQRLDESESDDGLDDGEEIIPSFGWAIAGKKQSASANQENHTAKTASSIANQLEDDSTEMDMDMDMNMDMDMDMDMEMTHAVGGIIKPQSTQQTEPEEEMSMDVTRAFGGILSQKSQQHDESAIEDDDDVPMEEATMEFTTAVGGIRHPVDEDPEEAEDMSMEFTTVMGGVLNQKPKTRKSIGPARRRTITQKQKAKDDDATMDMTVGLGRIISTPQVQKDEEEEDDADGDATMGMDMTTSIGGILSNATAGSRMLGKRIMEEEVDVPDDPDKAIMAAVNQTAADVSPETMSPGLSAFHNKGLRRSIGPQAAASEAVSKSRTPSPTKGSTTPKSTPRSLSVTKAEASTTPQSSAKEKAPASTTPSTPKLKSKSPKKATPQSSVRKLRSASKAPVVTPSPAKSPRKKPTLFQENPKTGSRTPTVVLTPQSRRLSGVGADRAGLGSPRIAALFDRRTSIGDAAIEFIPGKRAVAFEDPKNMEEELDKERQDEEDKEDRRKILEREADGAPEDKEATLNLREMIDSLSPKRNPLRGRKSLHVGSARGLLGKRQFDSDDEEEVENKEGVDRLNGHRSSPVKKIKLQQPPSKEETTGRLTKSLRLSLPSSANSATPTPSSPQQDSHATTPKNQGRFRDVEDDRATHTVNFNDSPVKDASQLEEEVDEERIHLQDFLNMTSIRFMELTTTKRRHTQAPESFKNGDSAEGDNGMSLERYVVAGACTVPMLELYQHSCRELKKYISEGRRMVKEIEMDTFEENPPLFREYMSASPEVKSLMDNQFKNVKAHARLLSKAMWYEWRMKLQDGIKEGLVKIAEGMEGDEECLNKQQELLTSVVPDVLTRHEELLEESENLEQVSREIADCDPAELDAARDELASLNQDIAQKKKLIAELTQQFQGSQENIEALTMQKQQCLEEIKEAEKVREECRGWTSTEVNSLKARVDAIEKEHGWAVTGISGTNLSLAYKREIEIVLDVAAFQTHKPNSRIDLWYIADARENNVQPKTPEKEFFLQCIRDHIRALPQSRTKISNLLNMVRLAWDKANLVSTQISEINVTFPTTIIKTSDVSVAMSTSLLLLPLETRVEVMLNLQGESGPDGLEVKLAPEAKVIYGENFNVAKIAEFLASRIGTKVGVQEEDWSPIMVELHQRLIERGRKG